MDVWMQKDRIPKNCKPQQVKKDPETRSKMAKKLQKVQGQRYITKGRVELLMSFFSIPKGKDNICMVYNGTMSGLNNAIWALCFPLPTADMHLCVHSNQVPGWLTPILGKCSSISYSTRSCECCVAWTSRVYSPTSLAHA